MTFGSAGVTQRQARFVADNILSLKNHNFKEIKYPGAIKTEIIKIFDYTLGRVGLNEKEIEQYYKIDGKNISINSDISNVFIQDISNVEHFDNSNNIYMLGFFDKKTKRLLGIQALGKTGIDKRLDIAATAIKANMTAFDLINLDLTYSPPYNTPKDILNILGSLSLKEEN